MMKKIFVLAVAALALVACQPKGTDAAVSEPVAEDAVYKGVLPAADCEGIEYELTLQGDTAYALTVTYLGVDAEGRNISYPSSGKLNHLQQEVDGVQKSFIELGDSDAMEHAYFLVVNDSTLRLVNSELQEPENTALYDIKKVK